MLDAVIGIVDVEVIVRLVVAVAGGATIGLNRFLRRKSAGTRTHAIVSLGAAMAALLADRMAETEAVSRVAQGLVTGVGFIGAGVILRHGSHIQGLTTAASIWTCAIYGICCGAGDLAVAVTGLLLALVMLLVGKPFEQAVGKLAQNGDDSPSPDDRASAGQPSGDPNKPSE